MARIQRVQPRWGRLAGVLIGVLILLLLARGAVEAAVLITLLAVLVASYLVRRRMRDRLLYHRHDQHGSGAPDNGDDHRRVRPRAEPKR